MSPSGSPDAGPDLAASADRRLLVGWAAFAVLAGVALRAALLVLPTGAFDSDEAVVGLMARRMIHHGELPVFYWGQAYGGTIEPALSVPLLLVSDGPGVVKAVPLVLSAAAAVLVWRVGVRTVGRRPAVLAAAAFFVWPANYVWLSTKGRGFYWTCIILGLSTFLVVLRIPEDPRGVRRWLALGALAGLGIWTTPQFVYFAAPSVVWLVAVLRQEVWRAVYAIPTGLLAGAPWLAFNATNDFLSLRRPEVTFDLGYLGNTWLLIRQGIPVALGLHAVERWLLVPALAIALYVLALAVVAVGVARRPTGTSLLVVNVVAFVGLWGLFPVSGVIGEGRYVMFLLPALALLLAHGLADARAQTAFLVLVVGLSVAGVVRTRDATAPAAPDVAMPRHLGPVIEALDEREIDRVYANYWISYRLTYETAERIVATPSEGITRFRPYADVLAADDRPAAHVFPASSGQVPQFVSGLEATGVSYDRMGAGEFTIVVPDRRVDYAATMAAGAPGA